jgi:hypothetical protein
MGTKSGPWVIFGFIAATLVLAITFSLLFTGLMLAYLLEYFLYIQHDCFMPKLVGNLTQTQITVAAAALQPQARKLFFSSENCKFYFLSGPPIP